MIEAQDDRGVADQEGWRRDFVSRSTEVLSTVSAFWILLLAAVYLYDIIGRGAFNSPFLGTHEIVGNSIVGILFLELPSTIKRGAMLRTTIVFQAVSEGWRRLINSVSYVFGIALFTTIIAGGWSSTITSWEIMEIEGAGAFEVPVYPVRTLILIFSAICVLVYAQLLHFTLTGGRRSDAPARHGTDPGRSDGHRSDGDN